MQAEVTVKVDGRVVTTHTHRIHGTLEQMEETINAMSKRTARELLRASVDAMEPAPPLAQQRLNATNGIGFGPADSLKASPVAMIEPIAASPIGAASEFNNAGVPSRCVGPDRTVSTGSSAFASKGQLPLVSSGLTLWGVAPYLNKLCWCLLAICGLVFGIDPNLVGFATTHFTFSGATTGGNPDGYGAGVNPVSLTSHPSAFFMLVLAFATAALIGILVIGTLGLLTSILVWGHFRRQSSARIMFVSTTIVLTILLLQWRPDYSVFWQEYLHRHQVQNQIMPSPNERPVAKASDSALTPFVTPTQQTIASYDGDKIQVGNKAINIPTPDGFLRVGPEGKGFLDAMGTFVPKSNRICAVYIHEGERGKLLSKDYQSIDRYLIIEVPRDNEDFDVNGSSFGIIKADLRSSFTRSSNSMYENKYIEESADSISYTDIHSTAILTSVCLHVQEKVIFLYVVGNEDALAWTRATAGNWVSQILAVSR